MRWLPLLLACTLLGACSKAEESKRSDDDDGDSRPRRSKKHEKLPEGPVVTIEGSDVKVDDGVVGTTRHIEDLGRLQKIDGLFDTLKGKREAWKAATPDKPFPGTAVLRAAPGTSMVAIKSVFQTIAYAGYPNITVETTVDAEQGATFVPVEALIPGPPDPEEGVGPPPPKTLHIQLLVGETKLFTKQGSTVLAEAPAPEALSRDLAAALSTAVAAFVEGNPTPVVTVHADNSLKLEHLAATLRALDAARGREGKPTFVVRFAINGVQHAEPDLGPPIPSASGSASVSGRLPPEVIQRIVRQNFDTFTKCYETGLKANPNLQGRVQVKFVISRDGSVSSVNGSGDIPDTAVISCVTRAFYKLTFPAPDGGIVTVTYPIVFTPSG